MDITYRHSLGIQEAKDRLNPLIDNLANKYLSKVSNPEYGWQGDDFSFTLRFAGKNITGGLSLQEEYVKIQTKIPLLLRTLQPRIEKKIHTTLDLLFNLNN